MNGISKEIYDYLSSIDKLDENEYKKLVELYGVEHTNLVIEKMIEMSEKDLYKFDYYVSKVINNFDDLSFKSNIDIYMNDIGMIPQLSQDDNIKYSNEAYDIVTELNSLFRKIGCNYVNKKDVIFNSIIDKVEFYLKNCNDVEISNRIKELKERFIYVREILVNGNLRAVVAALKPYFKENKFILDYIQYGNIGLMKAVEKYSPKYNALFITYAYFWIKQSIRNAIKSEFSTATTVSYSAMENNASRSKTINKLTNELGRYPTEEEIAMQMGISNEKLEKIELAFRDSLSLSSSLPNYGHGEKEFFLVDVIEDRTALVEESVYSKILRLELKKALKKHLNERQIFILLSRFGFYGEPFTLQQVGDILKLSRQAIEKSEKTALARVRRLSGETLRDFL